MRNANGPPSPEIVAPPGALDFSPVDLHPALQWCDLSPSGETPRNADPSMRAAVASSAWSAGGRPEKHRGQPHIPCQLFFFISQFYLTSQSSSSLSCIAVGTLHGLGQIKPSQHTLQEHFSQDPSLVHLMSPGARVSIFFHLLVPQKSITCNRPGSQSTLDEEDRRRRVRNTSRCHPISHHESRKQEHKVKTPLWILPNERLTNTVRHMPMVLLRSRRLTRSTRQLVASGTR